MSDNLPAVRQEATPALPADVDSWVPVLAPVIELAQNLANTDFVPKGLRGSVTATAAAILYGREVGLPPMTALTMTHVVDGRPSMAAEGMRMLVFAAGHEIALVEATGARVVMRGRRRGSQEWTSIEWNLDMARAAGLASKSNWKNHPRQMLTARATTELCRVLFPDVIHGFRSVEELEDMGDDAEAEETPAPAGPRTRVARKRTTKAPAEALPAPARADSVPHARQDGPPLPGEPGYETTGAVSAAPAGPGEGEAEPQGEGSEAAPFPDHVQTEGAESSPGGAPSVAAPGGDGTSAAPEVPGGTDDGADTDAAGEDAQSSPAGPRLIARGAHRMLMAHLGRLGIDGADEHRDDRLDVLGVLIGRDLDSSNNITAHEAKPLLDALAMCRDDEALAMLVDATRAQQDES